MDMACFNPTGPRWQRLHHARPYARDAPREMSLSACGMLGHTSVLFDEIELLLVRRKCCRRQHLPASWPTPPFPGLIKADGMTVHLLISHTFSSLSIIHTESMPLR